MNRENIIRMARQRKIRLVVADGEVISATDKQTHYVGPMTLLHLYGVPHDVPVTFYPSAKHEFFGWRDQPGDILLSPRHDGNYCLEAAAIRARGQA